MVVKFEHNRMVQTTWNFELFEKQTNKQTNKTKNKIKKKKRIWAESIV